MSKSNKELKKAAMEKRNRKKKIKEIIIYSGVVIAIALVVFLLTRPRDWTIYQNNCHTVTLQGDGTFTAKIDGVGTKSGTYTKNEDGGVTIILFSSDNTVVRGTIRGDVLTVPTEWDDGRNHNPRLVKK